MRPTANALLPFLLCFVHTCIEAIEPVCETKGLLNSAFLFVKPHANTEATQDLVKKKIVGAGIEIVSEHDINAEIIDNDKLIDQHYYSIASKATILSAEDMPVPIDRFQAEFGESWDTVLAENRACNAMEACKRFDCTVNELNKVWRDSSTKVIKFGGGFYCGLVSLRNQSFYVFNAFFMSMREKYVAPGSSIHCYIVQWDPSKLSWHAFRNKFVGSTNPAEAPEGSIRRTILENHKMLGLKDKPNKGDNGVHASASPFEGLAEKRNWLSLDVETDSFGRLLLQNGISKDNIASWSVDPHVKLPDGSEGSIFDALEDLDADDCKEKLLQIKNSLRENL
mmetsp:Transcript_14676/g.16785  ORF Transcript_14676/g.16785 Transcript_14676/m.16785 type:complete len:338 (+) Transcript_14676:51-1064(+)|eukprot:CAMPEP_0194141346 /NCGR_PEP_ID=MMETSP0152-20130528/10756_1 /TAXON_ID=1049557 /ORGANISM="Thalassiothrix antarctica, Strain L6-D1" /LENGTH=337 /DNA_ID=CAMNT_0038839931 /DNA_START=52 /DNA_END=1065 /DNA_ORIENTATION=-